MELFRSAGDCVRNIFGPNHRFMRLSIRVFSSLFIFAFFAFAQAADTGQGLDGMGKPTQAELATQPMPTPVLKALTLKMDGAHYEVTEQTSRGPSVDKGTLELEPSANPKGMSIHSVEGPNKGKTFPAIYELDGDALKICYDLSGKKRPTEFKTRAGTQLYLVTYQRVK